MSVPAVTRGVGLDVFLIFSAAAGNSGLSSVPEGFSRVQITMRYLSLRLGFIKARETAKGEGMVGEA